MGEEIETVTYRHSLANNSVCVCVCVCVCVWGGGVAKSTKDIRNLIFPLRLDYGRSPHAYVNQRVQIQLELSR
jgi:hypothetical protein